MLDRNAWNKTIVQRRDPDPKDQMMMMMMMKKPVKHLRGFGLQSSLLCKFNAQPTELPKPHLAGSRSIESSYLLACFEQLFFKRVLETKQLLITPSL